MIQFDQYLLTESEWNIEFKHMQDIQGNSEEGRGLIFENVGRRNLSDHRLISTGPVRNLSKRVWDGVCE